MTARPCYGCTLRVVDGQRCGILDAKLKGIKGLGLTSINFKCAKREDHFKPGQPVEFDADVIEHDYEGEIVGRDTQTHQGYVWKRDGFRVVVVSDTTNRPKLKFAEKRLRKLDTEARQCCIHCQKPQGLFDEIKSKETGEVRPYICRTEYNGGYTETNKPCEYPDGTHGPLPAAFHAAADEETAS